MCVCARAYVHIMRVRGKYTYTRRQQWTGKSVRACVGARVPHTVSQSLSSAFAVIRFISRAFLARPCVIIIVIIYSCIGVLRQYGKPDSRFVYCRTLRAVHSTLLTIDSNNHCSSLFFFPNKPIARRPGVSSFNPVRATHFRSHVRVRRI